ncbi:hypothetical protein NF867_14250 [Solitalea sp. MAHUQ-68]|uniref:Uncharacterized protein n=1 Tax=Solitalea agri TaxID=2953739 RepID=A0A9X2JDU3_9SPHI|nr:hypothetical protein [Solitalea agri]MCO4294024.1 hypothetical protein [Solitalea agri]
MSTVELRRLLIEKIKTTENKELLQEVYRLLDLEERDIVKYDLSDVQRNAINEAKEQIKTGRFLTNDQADNEIDEWLNK